MPDFYDGQQDYIQKLNEMADAFHAGPYDSVPKTGGTMSGPLHLDVPLEVASGGTGGTDPVATLIALVSEVGASLIAWKRAAVGAVNRLLSSWIEEFELTPRSFGCACDGVAIDNVNFKKFLDACKGRWGVIPDGDLVRLTVSPTDLTSFPIRLRGRSSQWRTGQVIIGAGLDYGGLLLDGVDTSIGGTWDLATNTVTYPQRVKGLCNLVIAGVNGARHGMLDFMDNAVIGGLHFQDFTDHHMFTFGSILNTYYDISGYGALLGKDATGTWIGGDFLNGCGWLCTGAAPSGVAGNFITGKTHGSNNFSSTNAVNNVFFDTAITNSTSCKGFIFYNVRSTTMKNCGGYSGAYMVACNIQWDSPHFEPYATGGEVAGDGNVRPFVALNCSPQTSNYSGATTDEPLILRTTPFTVATDYWGYFLQIGARWQISRLGVNELILGEKLSPGSTASQHVAAIGTADNPLVYWDKDANCLRISKGNSFQVLLGAPKPHIGSIPAGGAVDLDSAVIAPAVNLGNGPGGVYDIDVQILDQNNGAIFYEASWRGLRQIAAGKYNARFYVNGGVFDNNSPVGGFVVAEVDTGSEFKLRLSNGTGFPYFYRIVSRLRNAAMPDPV